MADAKPNEPTIIDADGHILEPPDLWEKYLEAEYRPRAIRIKKDSEGWEYAEIDGKPATCIDKYNLPRLSSMGRFVQEMRERRKVWIANGKKGPTPFIPVTRDETYMKSAGHGTMFPKERLERMDEEGLAKSVLYPTLGLAWEGDVRHDPKSPPHIAAPTTAGWATSAAIPAAAWCRSRTSHCSTLKRRRGNWSARSRKTDARAFIASF